MPTPTFCQNKHFFWHIPYHVIYTRLKRTIENYTPFLFSQNTKEMSEIKLHGRSQHCLENFMFLNSSQPFPKRTGERGYERPIAIQDLHLWIHNDNYIYKIGLWYSFSVYCPAEVRSKWPYALFILISVEFCPYLLYSWICCSCFM